jgi:diadenylate cyclase
MPTILDILDIVLVTVLLYQAYRLMADSRTLNLVRGLVVFGLALYASRWLGLTTLYAILERIAAIGVFALIVIFQPELRAVLERVGRPRQAEDTPQTMSLNEITRAVEWLSERKVGALVALERQTPLGDYANSGIKLDAEVSSGLLETIFARNTPLHDGGVIVQHGRIRAAGCLFPLQSDSHGVQRLYGTRHRAALGLSEQTDALVIVVSEERGSVRLAEGGVLSPDLTVLELRERLRQNIMQPQRQARIRRALFALTRQKLQESRSTDASTSRNTDASTSRNTDASTSRNTDASTSRSSEASISRSSEASNVS